MKLKETENPKLQSVNRIEINTIHINNIHDSDVDLNEKITEILNTYEKNPNFKGNTSFKKCCNYCRKYGHSITDCLQKQQDNQNKPQKYKEPNKSFYQYVKKDHNLPNRNIQSNNSSGHLIIPIIGVDHQNKKNSRIFSQSRYIRSNSQKNQYRNNYSRSNSNRREYSLDTSSHSNSKNRRCSNVRSRNSSYNGNRSNSNNRKRSYSNNRNQRYQNKETLHTTHLIINEPITTFIIIDHEITK